MSPAQWRDRALAALQAGRGEKVRQILAAAASEHPLDAALHNSAGNILLKLGDKTQAEVQFRAAASLAPTSVEFAVNLAITLSGLGRHTEAVAVLLPVEAQGRANAVYCSTRGTVERGAHNPAAAALWYDRALAIEPKRAKALHGRARVAIERGESDALARVDHALSVNRNDADLWLARAQTLDVMGDIAGARNIAEQLVEAMPQWDEGLKLLAQLRLAMGEANFASHYERAMERVTDDRSIPIAWANILAGLDFHAEAADVVAQARRRFPDDEQFALLEAIHSGASGDDDRADHIYARLAVQSPDRWQQEARHRIRRGEYDRAASLLDKAIAIRPDAIFPWALRGIVWRLAGDQRAEWLHHQPGMHRLRPLHDAEKVLPPAIELLHRLHDNSPMPLGQSLRGGSQTRGLLFDRVEPELAALHDAILATVEQHRREMPPVDPDHPILRHRDKPWHISGSWSVRLSGGGDHHTAHIHPQGVISSALYCLLPRARGEDPQAGWLELGRPPPDLRLDLGPIATIEPEEGHLALFPSTLYHGTRPFAGDRRMTVAFDVSLAHGAAP
nr:putative 2OG-Fe(II) oxygenase [Parerythrobacter lacustris]